ncbi:histone acetyltransferase GCN5 [Nannizzia gypsea CBS 118893]|uniref:Histone acetyltransferase GCN5 n=1 Tax=Arthroderma gypseum (strain ATCC MYA-4604 / CBS 118893) TaxID=535722 RepID=E4V5F5_ARTGP|nr:histone acetyltransferase GCN5 [Nannizzia gypsea CBS 118893]EFR05330.1 histone acetyltransferase GCN5 [Nannizzia gypsea CBS 118893]
MDKTESRALPANDARSHLGAKRPAPKELASGPSAKRNKDSHDEPTELDVSPPTIAQWTPFPDKPAVLEELRGEIEYRVVNNDGSRESTIILTGLKCLFQKQLPKMPKEYIARLAYDRTHVSIALVKMPLRVIGGIAYREFRCRKFAEIVFCAISTGQQAKGYGAHLMAHLKDYIRATSPVMHFLTYADDYATGYFQKQGFTKHITLNKAIWAGYIKDYEGGTLMQCSLLPRMRYLEAGRMLLKQKECVLAKIRNFNTNHVIHQPPEQWANSHGDITPIDPLSILAIRAAGWSPDMDELSRILPHGGPYFKELRQFLGLIRNHKSAWPFTNPVDKDEAPSYYDVIEQPMDLSTMEDRLELGFYTTPKGLFDDFTLIFNNCRKYNNPSTVFVNCANQLEKYTRKIAKKTPEWQEFLENSAFCFFFAIRFIAG